MSYSKISAISMVTPGIDCPGTVVTSSGMKRSIRRKLGPIRLLYSHLPGNKSSANLRNFLRHLDEMHLPEGGLVNHSLSCDPAVDIGVVAIEKLLKENSIKPDDVDNLVIALSAVNSSCPYSSKIKAELVKRGIAKEDVLRNWRTTVIAEGCVGWIKAVQEIETCMKVAQLSGGNGKCAIGVAIGINSIYGNGRNPHEFINYRDGASAGYFEMAEDNSGPFVFGKEETDLSMSNFEHRLREPRIVSLRDRVKNYFASNYRESIQVVGNIARRSPEYLMSLLSSSGLTLEDIDFIICSQGSEATLDKIEHGLAEKIREGLEIPKQISERVGKYLNLQEGSSKDICRVFLIIQDCDKGLDLSQVLNEKERALLLAMFNLHSSFYRVHDYYGYPGVASIPMAIAHGVKNQDFNLERDTIALVAAGLGGKIQGLVIDNRVTN